MPFGRRTPLETLALPGVILAFKYSQYRQKRREAASRRSTERELSALNHKIDKLLNKLEESEPELPTSQEDECVICINARATMQTSPCGHRVVCRRCFVKTIQSAVAQRLLPLRCVICRARITRLTSSSGTWRLQESASSYSMGTTKSWTVMGSSPSSYSVDGRVAQSTSLYSMSSGASFVSGNSSLSNGSNSSASSDGGCTSNASSSSRNGCGDSAPHRHHQHSGSCSDGCSGAYPRNPHHQQYNGSHHKRSKSCRVSELNRLPPIKEFRSPTKVPMPSPTNNPKIRFASYTTNSKTNEHTSSLEKETSLSIIVGPSATADHMSTLSLPTINASSTKFTSNRTSGNFSKHQAPASAASSIAAKLSNASKHHGSCAKIAPIPNLRTPIFNMSAPLNKKGCNGPIEHIPLQVRNSHHSQSASSGGLMSSKSGLGSTKSTSAVSCASGAAPRSLVLLTKSAADERDDNRKNENVEKRKRDEKVKAKEEKEARKEEKRLAREEERLAKQQAKEEKKKGKREAKEMLLADGRRK